MKIQRFLRDVVAAGGSTAILEVSSHALATFRVEGCEFNVAVLTNMAADHFDFHGSFENYRRQKVALFSSLAKYSRSANTFAVVNADDPSADVFIQASPVSRSYGIRRSADISASQIVCDGIGCRFRLDTPLGSREVDLRLVGHFNVYNALAAATTALYSGIPLDDIAHGLDQFTAIPGRMQSINCGQHFLVFVDFAHTAQGLAAAVEAVQQISRGRTIVVFGQAGERDRRHRVEMVGAMAKAPVFFVITTDNPLSEDPVDAVSDMATIAESLGRTKGRDFDYVVDRREAFRLAFGIAKPGDVVLLVSRGCETTISQRGHTLPFDDAAVAEQLLRCP